MIQLSHFFSSVDSFLLLVIDLAFDNRQTPGVNFINSLREAFTYVDPKSAKRQCWLDCLFGHLESTRVRAACKRFMKLTPDWLFEASFGGSITWGCDVIPEMPGRSKNYFRKSSSWSRIDQRKLGGSDPKNLQSNWRQECLWKSKSVRKPILFKKFLC